MGVILHILLPTQCLGYHMHSCIKSDLMYSTKLNHIFDEMEPQNMTSAFHYISILLFSKWKPQGQDKDERESIQ